MSSKTLDWKGAGRRLNKNLLNKQIWVTYRGGAKNGV